MRIKSLTLIGSNPTVLRSALVEATLKSWPEADCPPVLTTTIDHVLNDESILDNCGTAWIFLDETGTLRLYELVGLLQDRHLPAILTQTHETQPLGTAFQEGIVIAPPNTEPAALYAMVRTLWNQATVVRSLKDEVNVLQAHHGGLCEQIDKIDEELRLAAQLQREFLPHSLPCLPNVEFKALYRPAGYVSGDIYDVMALDEHHIGFFLADAAGHGVPAALMTMYIKRSLHTKEIDPETPQGYRVIPPNEALKRLNNDMVRKQSGKPQFATACYGILNTTTMEVCIARAGHPFPFLMGANGTAKSIEPDGMLLGVFANNEYEMSTFQMVPGDRLLLYSDGFETAFPQPGPGGKVNTQYAEEFKDIANGPLDKAIQRLDQKLDQQIGSLNQRDDITFLCVNALIPVPSSTVPPQPPVTQTLTK